MDTFRSCNFLEVISYSPMHLSECAENVTFPKRILKDWEVKCSFFPEKDVTQSSYLLEHIWNSQRGTQAIQWVSNRGLTNNAGSKGFLEPKEWIAPTKRNIWLNVFSLNSPAENILSESGQKAIFLQIHLESADAEMRELNQMNKSLDQHLFALTACRKHCLAVNVHMVVYSSAPWIVYNTCEQSLIRESCYLFIQTEPSIYYTYSKLNSWQIPIRNMWNKTEGQSDYMHGESKNMEALYLKNKNI